MEDPQEPRMTPFDQMLSDDGLQMLKASIPYVPVQMQGFLSVFAKVRELQNALSLTRKPPAMHMMSQNMGTTSTLDMLRDIGRYAAGDLKPMFDNLSSAFSAFQMLQTFQGMSSNMDGFNPENLNTETFGFEGTDTDSSEEEDRDQNENE